MKRTINFCEFCDAFADAGRKDTFSYYGLKALFEYLEDYEEETGEELELDVIALCCDFTEYEDIEEVKANYDCIKNLEDLYNYTTVIEFGDGLIIQDF